MIIYGKYAYFLKSHWCSVNLLRICRTPLLKNALERLLLLLQVFSQGTRDIIIVKFKRVHF